MPRIPEPSRPTPARERQLRELATAIGHEFDDLGLLERALSHSSLGNDGRASYERLEFLGDAILGFVVADHLFREHPETPEGELTDRRAAIVSRQPLAKVAGELELWRYLEVGRGLREDELKSPRIQADLVEAVLAAIYLDGGIRAARRFARRFVIGDAGKRPRLVTGPRDPKSRLLHLAQSNGLGQPVYEIAASSGPDHRREFEVRVAIDGREWGRGTASSKQAAGMAAAEVALGQLREHLDRREGFADEDS